MVILLLLLLLLLSWCYIIKYICNCVVLGVFVFRFYITLELLWSIKAIFCIYILFQRVPTRLFSYILTSRWKTTNYYLLLISYLSTNLGPAQEPVVWINFSDTSRYKKPVTRQSCKQNNNNWWNISYLVENKTFNPHPSTEKFLILVFIDKCFI